MKFNAHSETVLKDGANLNVENTFFKFLQL